MLYLRQIFAVTFVLVTNATYAQVVLEDYEFDEPEEEPIKEREYPEPVLDYAVLFKFLQDKISNGDTLGKKHSVILWNIVIRVNQRGMIDTTYISMKHGCGIQLEMMKFLKETQWYPATKEGKPISSKYVLHGHLYFSKKVLKRYNCW